MACLSLALLCGTENRNASELHQSVEAISAENIPSVLSLSCLSIDGKDLSQEVVGPLVEVVENRDHPC